MRQLGGGKALADQVVAGLAAAARLLRPAVSGTWRTLRAGLDRNGELGALAVVSMLMFQFAVGATGLLLISGQRAEAEPASPCATASCAVGASASEPLAATTAAPRPFSGLSLRDAAGAPRTERETAHAASTATDATDASEDPAASSAPPPEGEPTPEPEAQEEDETPLTAAMAAQARFDVVELPAPTDVFDLPVDPTVGDLPTRRMPYEEFAEHGAEMIERLPSLDVLNAYFPENPMISDVEAQKQHILHLAEQTEVSVEGYLRHAVDVTRRKAFRDLTNYHDEIEPRMFVVHWTGMGYRGVDHFVRSMKPHRVQYFIDRDARVFRLFESDTNWPAHALGANDFAQGVEIETGPFDEKTSPLFSYTPAQIEQTVYVAVDFLRRNGLPVDETTLIGHYAADLLFTNPYYDPHEGQFTRDRVRKFDPPQELMQVIVHKAQQLDAALDAK
jgi:hypothetical protein